MAEFGSGVTNIVSRLVQRMLIEREVAKTVFDASPFMKRFFAKKRTKPGDKWEIPLQSGRSSGKFFDIDGASDTVGVVVEPDLTRMLNFTPKNFADFIRLNRIKMAKIKGEAELLDYMSTQVDSLIDSSRDVIAEVLWAGNPTGPQSEPTGLNRIIDDGTVQINFGGFADRTTAITTPNNPLVSPVFDATNVTTFPVSTYGPAGELTLQKMHKVSTAVKQESNADMIVMDAEQYEKILIELLTIQRIGGTSGDSGVVGELTFNGAEVILERRATTGTAFWINSNHVYPCFQNEFSEFELDPEGFQRDTGDNTPVRTITSDIVLIFEIVSNAPNRCAKLTDLI